MNVCMVYVISPYIDEAVIVLVRLIRRALHEQSPVGDTLGGVFRVGLFDLPIVVQEGRKLCVCVLSNSDIAEIIALLLPASIKYTLTTMY